MFKELEMAEQTPPVPGNESEDIHKWYSSPVGVRILRRANKIYEDFPTSRYLLYFVIFIVEVIAVLWIGTYLSS